MEVVLNCHNSHTQEVVTQSSTGYQVMTYETLLAAQSADLQIIGDVLGFHRKHTRSLLVSHKWDVNRLLERLLQNGKERLLHEVGIRSHSTANMKQSSKISICSSHMRCGCCLEYVSQQAMTKMHCGHSFCNECWTPYFITKIKQGQSHQLKCMEHRCKAICDEKTVQLLVGRKDPQSLDHYMRALFQSYIEHSSNMKWCSSIPHCGNAIGVDKEPYCETECICGHKFCFNCLAEPHSPCCQMWQRWSQGISKTEGWLRENSRPCPGCHAPISKDGGCKFVSCRCRVKFCWHCGDVHLAGQYVCRVSSTHKKEKKERHAWKTYLSQWERQMDSLKKAKEMMEQIQRKIGALEDGNSVVLDHSWLSHRLQTLIHAQNILSFSFVLAFYVFKSGSFKDENLEQNNIKPRVLELIFSSMIKRITRCTRRIKFENEQMKLKKAVKHLSGVIKTALDLFNADDIHKKAMRSDVLQLTERIDTLCRSFYTFIETSILVDSSYLKLSTHKIAPYKSIGFTSGAGL